MGDVERPRADVERHVPPVVDRRAEGQARLADDLGPHVKCGVGVFPSGQGQLGPVAVWHGRTSGEIIARYDASSGAACSGTRLERTAPDYWAADDEAAGLAGTKTIFNFVPPMSIARNLEFSVSNIV